MEVPGQRSAASAPADDWWARAMAAPRRPLPRGHRPALRAVLVLTTAVTVVQLLTFRGPTQAVFDVAAATAGVLTFGCAWMALRTSGPGAASAPHAA